jgi:competence protein ComEC
MLDVGEGDALLLTDGEHALLVDTGPDPALLGEALKRQGVSKLDGVVLTHLHPDHSGGIPGLGQTVPYSKLYVPAGFGSVNAAPTVADLEKVAGVPATELRAGEKLNVGRIRVSVLQPANGAVVTDQNSSSLVALASAPGARALLASDAEAPVLEALIDHGSLGNVDVFKVGHHAAGGAVSESILKALSPSYALVSVGENDYGYPAPSTLRLLAARGIPTLRSDQAGDVSVWLGPSGAVLGK